LLTLLSGVSHSAKLGILWPLLKLLPENSLPDPLVKCLLACFDRSVGSLLNEKQSEHWTAFKVLATKSVEESGTTPTLLDGC
jgi:hypothetical protein